MDTEKSIKEMEARTYAYLSSGFVGALIPGAVLLTGSCFRDIINYLKYHNDVFERDELLPYYVNLKELPVYGVLSLIFIFALFVLTRFYVKRIRSTGRKGKPFILSAGIMLVSAVIFGYISIFVLDLFTRQFRS